MPSCAFFTSTCHRLLFFSSSSREEMQRSRWKWFSRWSSITARCLSRRGSRFLWRSRKPANRSISCFHTAMWYESALWHSIYHNLLVFPFFFLNKIIFLLQLTCFSIFSLPGSLFRKFFLQHHSVVIDSTFWKYDTFWRLGEILQVFGARSLIRKTVMDY